MDMGVRGIKSRVGRMLTGGVARKIADPVVRLKFLRATAPTLILPRPRQISHMEAVRLPMVFGIAAFAVVAVTVSGG